MPQIESSSKSELYGFNMSPECESAWQKSHKVYASKQLDPKNSQRIALFILEGLHSNNLETNKRNIEEMVRTISSEMNVTLSGVKFFSDPTSNTVGGYVRESNSMVLNLAQLNNEADFLMTVIHELRHAQQHDFMYVENSELAERIKQGITNYVRPTGKAIKNAQYFSSLVEVDAELVSYYFTQNILNQLERNSEFMANPTFKEKLEQAKLDFSQSEQGFNESLNISLKTIDTSKQARTAIRDLASSYAKILFSKENRDGSKTTKETSETIVAEIDKLISNSKSKDVVDFSAGDLYYLKTKIFDGVSSYDILKHLDDPFMQYLKQLEEKHEIVAASKYELFVSRLHTRVAEPLDSFFKRHNIPHTPNDYASMLETYFQKYPDVVVDGLLTGQETSADNFYEGMAYMFDDLKPQIEKLKDPKQYQERVPKQILEERAEAAVRDKKYSAASWIIPEFSEVCKQQIDKNMFGKYFTALEVPKEMWYDYSISEAWDVLKKTAPKFITQHILDDQISDFKNDIYKFCLEFGDVSADRLHKELLSHPILSIKLRALQKADYKDLPDMLKLLHLNKLPVQHILNPNKKKKEEQALS